MTFLTELSRLREAATKETQVAYAVKDGLALRNFLHDHAEAIEELVKAAEEILEWHPKMFEAKKLHDALEKLNRSE